MDLWYWCASAIGTKTFIPFPLLSLCGGGCISRLARGGRFVAHGVVLKVVFNYEF
jgi:hypothetical protein